MKMKKAMSGIYFRLRHFISRIGPWDYGTFGSNKARKHKIFKMVEIWNEQKYYVFALGAVKNSNWQEIPPFYWSKFKANK